MDPAVRGATRTVCWRSYATTPIFSVQPFLPDAMDPIQQQLQQALDGTYRIERELGGGGMSRVFLSTELAFERPVVLKVLPPELATGVSVERFKREISVAARLQHAGIVPLLSAGIADGLPWFSMPFVDGMSLRARLTQGEMPIADVMRTMRDVASALAYAHGKGVVHRDIKPENILLSEGNAVVSDFGVAKALLDAGDVTGSTLTSVGVALGTPAYMAPEQIAGDSRTDGRADVYSLGVVAYEMLSGHNPYAGRSPQATMAAHMTETPARIELARPATPAALAELVHRCLAKSAADRPQSAIAVVHALDAMATPTSTAPMHAGSAVAYPATSRRTLRVAAIVTGLLVLIGGGWYASHRGGSSPLNPRRIAVAPCEDLTGDPTLAKVGLITADYLTRQIVQTDSVDVVSGTTVAMVVGDSQAAQGDIVRRLAATTHAGSVITCTITKFGDSLRVQANIVDAATGSIKRALEPGVGPVSDPIAAVDALRERLLGSLVSGDLAKRVVAGAQPPKYSAYLSFIDGTRRFTRDRDYKGAQSLFAKAIELDSTFAAAYEMLAVSHSNRGEWENAERIVALFAERRSQLSALERTRLDWLQANLRGDEEGMVRAMRQTLTQDSSPQWLYVFGLHSNNVLRPADALPALLVADSGMTAMGWWQQATVTATSHHLLGDHDGELARFERARKDFPNERQIVSRELWALAGLHASERGLALLDTLLRGIVHPDSVAGMSVAYSGAQEFMAHGDSVTAIRMTSMGLEWARAHPTLKPTNARHFHEGRLWAQVGNLDSAHTKFERAAARDTNLEYGGWLGLVEARLGHASRAAAIADSLGAINGKWSRGSEQFWRGAILGALGRKDEAMALLKQGANRGLPMSYWHANTPLASMRGYAPFEAMIKPQQK
jgi:TolB-like protein